MHKLFIATMLVLFGFIYTILAYETVELWQYSTLGPKIILVFLLLASPPYVFYAYKKDIKEDRQ